MKLPIILIAVVFSLTVLSCKSTPTQPTTDGSTLIVPVDTLSLAKNDSSKTMILNLSCGCGFTLQITGMTGDTNVIKYTTDSMDSVFSAHQLRFWYSPSKTSSMPGPVTLNFLAHKHSYSYTNKVTVKVGN